MKRIGGLNENRSSTDFFRFIAFEGMTPGGES